MCRWIRSTYIIFVCFFLASLVFGRLSIYHHVCIDRQIDRQIDTGKIRPQTFVYFHQNFPGSYLVSICLFFYLCPFASVHGSIGLRMSVRLHVYAICICLTLSVCTYVYCTGNIFWSPFLNFYMNLEFKLCCKYCMYIVHVQYKVLSCCFCLKYDKSIALFYTEGVHSYLAICLSACVTMNYLSIYLTVKSLFKPIYFMQD